MRWIAVSALIFFMTMSVEPLSQYSAALRGNYSTERGTSGWFKVLDWNIDRGLQMEGISTLIQHERPDVVLLQEADLNASRTRQKDVAEELARKLSFNYVFGIEFEELAQGSRSSPAYLGQAILSRFPIYSSRILRFSHQSKHWQPRPYLPRWPVFQPRLGGRMALIAAIGVGNATVVFYDLHLESQGSERLRLQQLDEVLADVTQYPSDACLILAGDFNTDVRRSPLAQKVIHEGFRNVVKEGSLSTKPGGAAKDWVFVRGPVQFDEGKVHQDTTASDHFPITSYLSVSCFEQQEKQQ
jgi:endonuclease/exonuclease/phosphatase family metal-dependent hydrolase